MKHHSERMPDNARGTVPLIMVEGKRLIQRSARRAGATASRVAKKGRRIVGQTVHETERLTRRNPLVGLGIAMGAGFLVGGLCSFLFTRGR